MARKGLLLPDNQPAQNIRRGALDVKLLHRMECKVCPLDKVSENKSPHMKPSGSDRPLIYVLGDRPSGKDDKDNIQFAGETGRLLGEHIPDKFVDHIRYNYTVRTQPPKGRAPSFMEIECCRPSIIRDIEETKPFVVLGFGNAPLHWVSNFSGIQRSWRGRRMPVYIGKHACWYYPMLSPLDLLEDRERRNGNAGEDERMFGFDMQRAFGEIDTLRDPKPHTPEDARRGVEIVSETNEEALATICTFLEWAAEQPLTGFDYETTAIRPYKKGARILTAAIGTPEKAMAFLVDHPRAQWPKKLYARLIEALKAFIRKAKGVKAVHNLAFELEWTGVMFGTDLIRAGKWECTAVQASILDERTAKQKPGPFSLEFLVQNYFGFNLKDLSPLDKANLADEPIEKVLLYNGMDSKYHACLWDALDYELEQQGLYVAYDLALRRVPTVVLSQIRGVPLDQVEVARLKKKYSARLAGTVKQIAALRDVQNFKGLYKEEFNPGSNDHVMYLLDDMLKRPEIWKESNYGEDKKSADEEALLKIDHPIAQLLLDFRSDTKQLSTYVRPLSDQPEDAEITCVYPDGMLHAQFNTFFAQTGRLSCEGPNLQNFPKRDGESKEVRRMIVAPDGHYILAFDYGQIEARVIAMFTKDPVYVKSLWENYDIHMDWAERLAWAWPDRIGGKRVLESKGTKEYTDVMKLFRADVKNQWTFPLFFGAQLESVASYLKMPVDSIKQCYRDFWKEFETTAEWQKEQLESYRKYGYVETMTGRRRHGPMTGNQVYNSPIQGTAAEIVMDGMCRLSETGDPELQPEINIHDDLSFLRVADDRLEAVAEKVITHMLSVPFNFINVPIMIEMSYGRNWLDMEDLGKDGKFSSDTWFK